MFWSLSLLQWSVSAWMLQDVLVVNALQGLSLHYPSGFMHFWDLREKVSQTILPQFHQNEQSWTGVTSNAFSACLYSAERGETLCADWSDWAGHPSPRLNPRFSVPRELPHLESLRLHDDGYCVIFGPQRRVRCEGFSASMPDRVPVGLEQVRELRMSREQACAITLDDRLSCWGSSARAEYEAENGYDEADIHESLFLVPDRWKEALSTSEVALGDDFRCALSLQGEVECWGDIESKILRNVKRLLARDRFGCVLQENLPGVECFGQVPELVAESLPQDEVVEDLVIGEGQMCMMRASKEIFCRLLEPGSPWKRRGSFGL